MSQRMKFVVRAMMKEEPFSHLCSEFGIATKTGYKWIERFKENGRAGLENRSRKPKTSAKQVAEEVVLELVRIKTRRAKWGPRKVRRLFAMNHPGEEVPSLSTVSRVLDRAGLVEKRRKKRVGRDERVQNRRKPEEPNDVWTVDFKGWWYTRDKEKCEPLTVRDEFSKYILSAAVLKKSDIASVKREFERLFKEHGLPRMIRSDNGPPFASAVSVLGLTRLSVWWMSLGIKLDRIDPGSPQQNGGHERMHRDMKREVQNTARGDLSMYQSLLEVWRTEFNEERPHEALAMRTPAEVYRKSERKYEVFDAFEYPDGFKSRQVNNRGKVCCRGRTVFISNAFNGFNVGMRYHADQGWEVWFERELIGWIEEATYLFISVRNKEFGKGKVLPMS